MVELDNFVDKCAATRDHEKKEEEKDSVHKQNVTAVHRIIWKKLIRY